MTRGERDGWFENVPPTFFTPCIVGEAVLESRVRGLPEGSAMEVVGAEEKCDEEDPLIESVCVDVGSGLENEEGEVLEEGVSAAVARLEREGK